MTWECFQLNKNIQQNFLTFLPRTFTQLDVFSPRNFFFVFLAQGKECHIIYQEQKVGCKPSILRRLYTYNMEIIHKIKKRKNTKSSTYCNKSK